jgi:hypothetical protein
LDHWVDTKFDIEVKILDLPLMQSQTLSIMSGFTSAEWSWEISILETM